MDSVEEGILSAPLQPYRSNIPKDEEAAMARIVEAQKKRLITLKPNDKMGGQSILPTEDYIESLIKQLEDSYVDEQGETHHYYQPVEPFLLTTHHSAIKDFLDGAAIDGVITEADVALLLDEEPKASRLYGLVKNHKPIKQGQKIPDLRPVVSNSGSATEKISLAIDQEAKHMVANLPSFWQDSPHAIRDLRAENIKGPQPPQCIPVTADVISLYPNIPLQEGMEKFREALDNPNLRPQPKLPTTFLLTLLSFVLFFNVFIFNGQHFLQLIGTAMGTRVAPTFACIFMGWVETMILASWMGTRPHLWRRYIDDIFFLWYGTEEELLRFIEHCNKSHETIKFTFDYNFKTRSVDFLDIHIWIDHEGWIQTDLFHKDGKKCQLLLPSSAHPGHCSWLIPYSIAYRLQRLCWS